MDLASFTLFLETGYVCLSHFLCKFHPKHNQRLFETLPKLVSWHTWLPNYQKNGANKITSDDHSSQKEGGGVRQGSLSQIHCFFCTPSLNVCYKTNIVQTIVFVIVSKTRKKGCLLIRQWGFLLFLPNSRLDQFYTNPTNTVTIFLQNAVSYH